MSKPRVWITQPIPAAALERLEEKAQVDVWQAETPPTRADIAEKAAGCAGVISMLADPLDAAFFAAAGPQLKVIAQYAVGVDNIDLAEATRRGVAVGHTPGVLTETTADLAFGLMLAVARRIVEGHNEVQHGLWRPWGPDVLTGYDVFGATLGIVGFGRIGQAVARRAAGFSMRVLYHDHHRHPDLEEELGVSYAPLDELLAQADFVSLHVYLSPQNYHLIGADQFARMKPNAILVNTARGGVVDTAALAEALRTGRIAGAGLDVTEPEPIPPDSPLLGAPNVVITPHIGSASKATRLRMGHICVDNLLAGLAGERLPFCANPAVYPDGK